MKLFRDDGLFAITIWRLCFGVYWRFGLTVAVSLGFPASSWRAGPGYLAAHTSQPSKGAK